MIFRRPIDPDKNRSKEEKQQRLNEFRENKFSKKEEWQLIWIALKTFLPAVIGVCAVFALVAFLIIQLWS